MKDNKGPQSIKEILSSFKWDKDKYISQEFQNYGYHLAEQLKDLEHKALYIKMAKELPRGLLEKALSFVKDASHIKKPGSLFMWKVKELKKEKLSEKK